MGIRDERRATVEAEILRVAREHLTHSGAAALSLRAIARDLGMVSSGIYRYVESRDELLTRLIVRAYSELAAQVNTAHACVDSADLEGRWDAIAQALRTWALANPHDFALVYGSPVPDYSAPAERTSGPGTAVQALLMQLLDDARSADRVPAPTPGQDRLATVGVGPLLDDPFFANAGFDATTLARGLSAWTLLLGAVTSEIFQQLGPVADPEHLFAWHSNLARSLVLTGRDPAALPPTH